MARPGWQMLCAVTLALLLGFMLPRSADADTLDDIRQALVEGDPEALDAVVIAAHAEAEASGDVTLFWAAFTRAFRTSHGDRLRTLGAWRAARPDSAFALTAEAVARAHLDHLSVGRGVGPMGTTRLRLEPAPENLVTANVLALRAIQKDARMVPAYDTLFSFNYIVEFPISPPDLLDELLTVYPSRSAMLSAMTAYIGKFGPDVEPMFGLCGQFAERIPGYDGEACAVDAVYIAKAPDGLRDAANRAIASRPDDAMFEEWRFRALMRWRPEGYTEAELAWLVAYHRQSLNRDTDPYAWLMDAYSINTVDGLRGYIDEALPRVAAAREEWLLHDPFDSELIAQHLEPHLFYVDQSVDPTVIEGLRRHWRNAMVYGQGSVRLWLFGAALASNELEAEAAVINAIVAGKNDLSAVAPALVVLGLREDAAVALHAAGKHHADGSKAGETVARLQCLNARIARLYDAMCRVTTGLQQMCEPEGRHYQPVAERLSRLAAGDLCAEVMAIPIGELPFAESVLVPSLDAFLAAHRTGLD